MDRSRGCAPRVAFQGEPGAFSEDAALVYFGGAAETVPCRDFAGVGAAVARGDVAYGVLPVENTLAGSVVGVYDVLLREPLEIVGEVVRPIRHCLLGVPGARVEGVRRILSHPVALAQCTRYLASHPAEAVAVYDTAGAAKEVAAAGDATQAAVAGRIAAERYGLIVLADGIEDRPDNQTRFYVVERAQGAAGPGPDRRPGPERPRRSDDRPGGGAPACTGARPGAAQRAGPGEPAAAGAATPAMPAPGAARYRTVLVLETEDRPGALVAVLAPFAEHGINLAKLESRPADDPWRYRFFLELAADAAAPAAARAIDEVRARTVTLRVLGSFPCDAVAGAEVA
ncbi:MAG TPA: prephenate dehydratase domain-containing protein [Longimicrobiales bacterium]